MAGKTATGTMQAAGSAKAAGSASTPTERQAVQHKHPQRLACIALAATLAISGFAITGCSSGNSSDQSSSSESASTSSTETLIADIANMDRDYTSRDKDPSYDEASATTITLNDNSATIEGAGATSDGSTVTISSEGTYLVSGTLTDGQLVVDATNTEKVQIVLAGVNIYNADGPALYVKQADKCFVTLAEGSENTLSDGSAYVLEDDSDEPYATLFSKDDLTINGTGSLTVKATYRHGICSKDDLVITGGTITVEATEDALRGRDCVKICDGTITLTAGEDAIKSNNDTDPTRGFVSIDGGTISINAKDDAVHGEFAVFVEAGTLDVSTCYEGLEAQQIYVNGGDVTITSSDDALNASSPGDTTTGGAGFDFGGQAGKGDEAFDASSDGEMQQRGFMSKGEMGAGTAAAGDATASDAATGDTAASGASGDGTNAGGRAGGVMPDGETAPDGAMQGDQTPPDGATMPDGSALPDKGTLPDASSADGAGAGASDGTAGDAQLSGDMPVRGGGAGAGGGMAAEYTEGCLIEMNGGQVTLTAQGDGVDSNGDFTMNGGTLFVSGPTNNANGSLDVAGSATINGGNFFAAGSAGMAQVFTAGSQAFLSAQVSGDAGASVEIVGPSGEQLFSYSPTTAYSLVIASCPDLQAGTTYTINTGQGASTTTATAQVA